MWRFIWWGWAPETAHAHSQWGEATQVHTMRLCMFTGNHSKKAHQNTFLTKASQINANGATSLQWQDSISTNIYSTTAEKNHMTIVDVGVHSLKHNVWKATSAFTYQCTKCSFSSAQSSNLKQHMIRHSTTVGLRQHIVIVIYSATPRSTWTTLIFYDFIIIITWRL